MIESLRVAAIAAESRPGETAENLAGIREWCVRAAREGAQLAVFPELSVTGFLPNHPLGDHAGWLRAALAGARHTAEPIAGRAVARLTEIAAETGVYVAAGLLEDAGNLLYNAMVLVGPKGLAGVWRKMHIPMFEMPFYNGGGAVGVAETPFGRVGANICFDTLLPESTRLLAVQNVEVVLFPFAADPPPGTASAWADWAGTALRARCAENGVFGVACNYQGEVEFAGVRQRFPGGAMIVGPSGEVIAERRDGAPASSMLLAELRAETLLDARARPEYLFRFRRPELYRSLAE
jgi:N-carbamoylputrescine amidase